MKQKFLLKTMLLLSALVVGFGNVWATDYSYTFSSQQYTAAGAQTLNGVSWTMAGTGGSYFGYDGTKGQQFGSGAAPYSAVSLTTSGISGTITSVVVNTSGAKSIEATVAVSVGATAFKCGGNTTTSISATATDYTFTGSASGNVVISWAQSSSKAIYIKSITVTYSMGSGPSISVTPTSRTVSYDTEDGTLSVTCNKIDDGLGTDIEYYEADGTTPTTYAWFTADINGDGNVEYILEENTDDVNNRTAYFKVYGYNKDDDTELIESDLISITQSKFTVDYANLPFAFDGGKGDLPTGMTHSGLGGDYGSSPKLKFDTQGDYLILKVKGALLQQLKFDIKGNSLSGTYAFKVQWSANGTDYTDLATYTSITTETKTIDISGCSGLKYIKWVYTTKDAGNVALGNIKVTPQTESVTVSSDSYATYVSSNPLNFTTTAIKAYIAIANGKTGVTFTQINKVPANTGVLLYKDGGATENIPISSGATDATTGNVFKAGTGVAVVSVSGNLHNYILNKVGGVVGFYKAAGQTVATNRAYIQIDESAGVKEFIALPGMEDDADGINSLTPALSEGEGAIYNLAGQRISKMQKGINIVNGKKVLK